MTYPSRKNLLVTISPTPYAAPLLLDLVSPRGGVFAGIAVSGMALVGRGGAGAPYTYTIASGSLPTGLSLNATTGAITGTPTTQGNVSFVAQVQDSASNTFQHQFAINVVAALFVLHGGGEPVSGRRGVAYTYQFRVADATGSTSGITYAVTSGSLPGGLSLSSGGLISGTPTGAAVGVTYFTVTATKSGVGTLAIPCSLEVFDQMPAGTLTIPTTLRNMTKGIPVSDRITFAGVGKSTAAAFVFSIVSGALPSGLSMDANGFVTGTPDAVTTTSYVQPTIRVTDPATLAYLDYVPADPNSFNVRAGIKSAANGLMYRTDVAGEAEAFDYIAQYFGDGSDGDITINGSNSYSFAVLSGGVNTLSREIYANNLTITGSGILSNNSNSGYDIYVAGVLDISSAGANGIFAGGGTPSAGSSLAGAFGTAGGTAGVGATGAGGAGGSASNVTVGGGGRGGIGGGGGSAGDGGAGSSGAAGSSGTSGNIGIPAVPRPFVTNDIYQTPATFAPIGGGAGGGGGGGGGGNGIAAGANGGLGGGGGGRLRIFARTINRSGSTAAGAISAKGAAGINGSAGAASGRAGGGGGLGGGGGKIRIVFGDLTGSTATNAIDASGGTGGNGGNSGGGTATAGKGGSGGYGGSITLNDLLNADTTVVTGSAGSVNSGQTGGAGGSCKSDL
jgi:hypothetical protein